MHSFVQKRNINSMHFSYIYSFVFYVFHMLVNMIQPIFHKELLVLNRLTIHEVLDLYVNVMIYE